MARPHINRGASELASMVEQNKANPRVLQEIHDELSHRKTKRAKDLQAIVADLLAGARSTQQTPSSDHKVKTRELYKQAQTTDAYKKQPVLTSSKKANQSWKKYPDLNMEFDESADIITNFVNALAIEIVAVKNRSIEQSIELRNGRKTDSNTDGHIYVFLLDEDIRLQEDAPIVITVAGKEGRGSIVSVSDGRVIIISDEDFGSHIAFAQIQTDNSYLLLRLQERFQEIQKQENIQSNFNRDMMEKALGLKPSTCGAGNIHLPLSELNEEQQEAVKKACGADTLYLWGPPGTGKSYTLARAICSRYLEGKKILLVSNTNQAVDSLLLAVCNLLNDRNDQGFLSGSVIRNGNIANECLKQNYEDKVSVDAIVARLGQDLEKKRQDLQSQLDDIRKRARIYQDIIQQYNQLEALTRDLSATEEELTIAKSEIEKLRHEESRIKTESAECSQKLKEARNAGAIRRIFTGLNPEKLQDKLRALNNEAANLPFAVTAATVRMDTANNQKNNILERRAPIETNLRGKSRADAETALKPLDESDKGITRELQAINAQLARLREEVLSRSRIVAATATQAYLKAKEFTGYNIVVVDEASMLTLPAAAYILGLAGESSVVAGDFRQLPSIVASEHEAVQKWVAQDVFSKAGIVEAVDTGGAPECLVKLTTQYRMDPAICELINMPFYGGILKTGQGAGTRKAASEYPAILRSNLVLVDTGSQNPFVNTKPQSYSRYNLLHAIAIRNLVQHLSEQAFPLANIGVISPYSAQAKIIGKMIKEQNYSEVVAGTVHRFQGGERDVIVLDIADSIGLPKPSQFIRANSLGETGAKLLNVAFSRARSRLVCFANVAYLEKRLPSDSYLSRAIAQMRSVGFVIDVAEILNMNPDSLSTVWSDRRRSFDLDKDTAFFNQDTFDTAVYADVIAAEKSVVIFSGFSTPQRVAAWSDLLRFKVHQGVKVRCVTRDPANQGNISEDTAREALLALVGIGVGLDLRRFIHEKVVMVDGKILWFGSLNPLSHTGRTDESMLRTVSQEACLSFADNQIYRRTSLRGKKGDELDNTLLGIFAEPENPICPNCQSKTVFFTQGKFGPYFRCAKQCGWSCSLDRVDINSAQNPIGDSGDGKVCPECGAMLVVRRGKRGAFWGCLGYPGCNHTEPLVKKGMPHRS